jgi:hypothetical protein
MRLFKCPKCGRVKRERFALAMAHDCPKNKSKWTEWDYIGEVSDESTQGSKAGQ